MGRVSLPAMSISRIDFGAPSAERDIERGLGEYFVESEAYERWSARADSDLTVYLDAALSALSAGFDISAMQFPEQRLDTMAAPGT